MSSSTQELIQKVNTAIAWAEPDQECVGYSRAELVDLLKACRDKLWQLSHERGISE